MAQQVAMVAVIVSVFAFLFVIPAGNLLLPLLLLLR
jgi:hypothetical protein